jgi:hypothetical protein
VNALGWSRMVLAAAAVAIPGCLLVQPLDDAKSNAAGSGGSTSSGGKTSTGGKNNGVSGADDGDAGDGPAPLGGRGGSAPTAGSGPGTGGGPPSGVDFSLFLGKWYPTGGTVSTLCSDSGSTTPTVEDATLDYYDQFDLGDTSDLLWDVESGCPLYIAVDDRLASADPNYPDQICNIVADGTHYPIEVTYKSFDFSVKANGTTATSSTVVTEYVTDTNGTYVRTCVQDFELTHSRTAPPSAPAGGT